MELLNSLKDNIAYLESQSIPGEREEFKAMILSLDKIIASRLRRKIDLNPEKVDPKPEKINPLETPPRWLFEKIYVINSLDREPQWESIKDQFEKLNLPTSVELERVDPFELSQITPLWLSQNGYTLMEGVPLESIVRTLSHIKTWEKAFKDGYERVLIIEDAILLEDDFSSPQSQLYIQVLEQNWDIFHLYCEREERDFKEEIVSGVLSRPGPSKIGVASVYTKSALERLLMSQIRVNLAPLNEFISYMTSHAKRPLYEPFDHDHKIEALAFNVDSNNLISLVLETMGEEEDFEIVAVASDECDGLTRFTNSLKRFGLSHTILGLNEPWLGGDMANPGGGYKVNLLRDYLTQLENKDTFICFTDAYDVVFNAKAPEIIAKFKAFNKPVVFSAEVFCWPDEDKAPLYPEAPNQYKYLNSGGFMGRAKDILKLLKETIDNKGDDQRYLVDQFLADPLAGPIQLDYKSKIFQTLAGSEHDVDINFKQSKLVNSTTKSMPSIVHGNGSGSTKLFFNHLAPYIGGNWNSDTIYSPLDRIEPDDTQILFLCLFINRDVNSIARNYDIVKDFLKPLETLTYPKLNTVLYIINEYPEYSFEIKTWMDDMENRYKRLFYQQQALSDKYWDDVLREESIKLAQTFDASHYFVIDNNVIIKEPNTIQLLIRENKSIIAPMINSPEGLGYNFWSKVTPDEFYEVEWDHEKISSSTYKGIWNMPHINDCYLIQGSTLPKVETFYSKNFEKDRGTDMAFCKNCRDAGIFLSLSNLQEYAVSL